MRTITSGIASGTEKFSSGQGDTTFHIWTAVGLFTVDNYGNVLVPAGTPLVYCHSDKMQGCQSSYTATVKDFLTVSPDMDSPASKLW